MPQTKRIRIRGKPRTKLDPELLAQVLIAIALEMARDSESDLPSPDVFEAAIEDRRAAP